MQRKVEEFDMKYNRTARVKVIKRIKNQNIKERCEDSSSLLNRVDQRILNMYGHMENRDKGKLRMK